MTAEIRRCIRRDGGPRRRCGRSGRAAAPGACPRTAALALTSLFVVGATPALGQLPLPEARSLGLGDHLSAGAHGPTAVAGNPAGLGFGSDFSVVILPVRLDIGLDPVSAGDVGEWQGRVVPDEVRRAWLRRVREVGRERGAASLGVSALSLAKDRWGMQLSTVASGRVDLNADATELILFGNAGLEGEPGTFDLADSSLDGWVVTTLGVGYGSPVGRWREGTLAVGATVKLSVGNALVVGRDVGSTIGAEPIDARFTFPLLSNPSEGGGLEHGTGVGLDVGAQWRGRTSSFGVTVRNLFHTFAWDLDGLAFRPGTALFDQEDSNSDFDERPVSEAPDLLRDAVDELTFRPEVALGAEHRPGPDLLVVTDLVVRSGEGLRTGPAFAIGVGAEFLPAAFLPVRGHLSVLDDGFRLGGGVGVRLGRVRLSGSGAYLAGGAEADLLGMFSIAVDGGEGG